ncbi:creatininase family protein [Pseudooceanicola sp. CBS1P-1]|uniref:Creatininase family protein n=1 Tax=Pseudooceanicola albus TaxID=2692189 RepID=A0A6L7G494_9RHOB|nr:MULTISPECIES: creatininase family protein [Pseudooceanicola]MBT9382996.1 creatininase family protein [Pseudooceanicola endophyticus]MXN19184.1 creatininase family protein [Pseudooceanicola albus]
MSARDWKEFRAPEFIGLDPMKTIAVLPVAAIEQHGPHLPVGTDTIINEGNLALLKQRAPADMDIRILPVQAVGKSNEHLWAAGTITLSAETALRAWTEIGLSVARAGIRKLVIMNSHGGNADLISIVSRELRVQAGMFCVRLGWGATGGPQGLYSEQERTYGIHGGDSETSQVLNFAPNCVEMSLAEDFRSSAETSLFSPIGPVAYGWTAADCNPKGVVGEAHLATAEKGATHAETVVDGMIALLRKVEAQSLDGFAPAMAPGL